MLRRLCAWTSAQNGYVLVNHTYQIRLSVGPIFMVLPITSSFLVRFWSVKYWIEGLNVLFPMARKWLIKSWFWSGHFLVKLQSNLVNSGQLWSILVKPFWTSQNVPLTMFWEILDAFELLSDWTQLSPTASFCMPIPEKIQGVKIGLWQRLLPLPSNCC